MFLPCIFTRRADGYGWSNLDRYNYVAVFLAIHLTSIFAEKHTLFVAYGQDELILINSERIVLSINPLFVCCFFVSTK